MPRRYTKFFFCPWIYDNEFTLIYLRCPAVVESVYAIIKIVHTTPSHPQKAPKMETMAIYQKFIKIHVWLPSGILSIGYLGSGEMKALIWVTDGQELAMRRCKMDKIGLKAKYVKNKSRPAKRCVPSWISSHPQCLPAAYWQFLAVCINCKQMDGQIDKKMDGQTVKGTYSRMYCSSIFRQMTGIWGDNNLK